MIKAIASFARKFRKDDTGNATVEFAILAPVFLFFMMAAVEVGMITLRSTLLERGLDQTVRWVRLNTGSQVTHAQLKDMICQNNFMSDCASNMHLEMIDRDLRNWNDLPRTATCTDRSLDVQPVSNPQPGVDNELMVLRACAKFQPIFPSSWFTSQLVRDQAGDVRIVAMTAFVMEPR